MEEFVNAVKASHSLMITLRGNGIGLVTGCPVSSIIWEDGEFLDMEEGELNFYGDFGHLRIKKAELKKVAPDRWLLRRAGLEIDFSLGD